MKKAILVHCLLAALATAQLPAHDECATAYPLGPGDFFDTLVGATPSSGNGGCAGFGAAPDVWYTFTWPSSVQVVLTAAASVFQPRVGVFSGSCGALSAVACGGSMVGFNAEAGQTYTIRLTSTTSSIGVFKFMVTVVVPVTNDDCGSALPVGDGVNPGSPGGHSGYLFTNSGASDSFGFGDPCGGGGHPGSHDVYFVYTATCGAVTIATCVPDGYLPGSLADTMLSVYDMTACSQPLPGPSLLACNDDVSDCSPKASRVTMGTTPGASYLIRVSSWSTVQTGNFYLTIHAAGTFAAGAGCNGIGASVPTLSSTTPVIGEYATITLGGFAPNSLGGIFIAYCAAEPYFLSGSCPVWLDVTAANFELVTPFLTDSQGSAVLVGVVPNFPHFQCKVVCTQAIVVPASGNYQLSNGLAVFFGF